MYIIWSHQNNGVYIKSGQALVGITVDILLLHFPEWVVVESSALAEPLTFDYGLI